MSPDSAPSPQSSWSRRRFMASAGAASGLAAAGAWSLSGARPVRRMEAETFVARASSYDIDLSKIIGQGLAEIGVGESEIKGRRVMLKPNLVESHAGWVHINTHPSVIQGAAEAFLRLGAAEVVVAEGPGHRRDTLMVLDESGLGEALLEDGIRFVDLNYAECFTRPNAGGWTPLDSLTLPNLLREADIIVSMPKMKTHHWVGLTLSMKNLFGVMPGLYYGWPKNVLHWAGIPRAILDINATVRPHLAIVDGVIGMEGDGPLMGDPIESGVVVMGRSLPAVDATCARIMGIDPAKIEYLVESEDRLGPIDEKRIVQRGESIASVRSNFKLLDFVPAHHGIRLL